MIKKIAFVLAYGLFGFALACLIEFFITGICQTNPGACPFARNCGEDCGGWIVLILGPLIAFLVYSAVALFSLKKKTSKRKTLAIFGALSLLVIFTVGASYLYFLIEHSRDLYAIREIQADSGYAPPVLAKEEIQVFEKEGSTLKPLYMMKQWERCALGDADDKDSFISINCKTGAGWIKKSEVSNLIKLPMQ